MSNNSKPTRNQFKTYLTMIDNSIGSKMFRNWWVSTPEQGEFDAMDNGNDSCAFYVSGLLTIFGKVKGPHGTVNSTVKDLEESGWEIVSSPKPGDVLVWQPKSFSGKVKRHIGFYVGDNYAVSTSWKTKSVQKHDYKFSDDQSREIETIYRLTSWH